MYLLFLRLHFNHLNHILLYIKFKQKYWYFLKQFNSILMCPICPFKAKSITSYEEPEGVYQVVFCCFYDDYCFLGEPYECNCIKIKIK